jgi:agmatine/peptidylarginine deiminase
MHPNATVLPAEWAPQQATLLAWPAAHTDWADQLDAIQAEYRQLIHTITDRQAVVLLVPSEIEASQWLQADAAHPVIPLVAAYNDTWCRDYGPITAFQTGQRIGLDFQFDGWGGQFDARLDNQINRLLPALPLLSDLRIKHHDWVLEGGAIDGNGEGTLLVNWHCLRCRNPAWSMAEWRQRLCGALAVHEVIGIDLPPMPGDDTDGHIDTLVRFICPHRVAVQRQADTQRDQRLMTQLAELRLANGQSLEIVSLPPATAVDPQHPASYANFLFINGACLVPAFNSPADDAAASALAAALPDHDLMQVPSATLITQSGSLHCASMQLPLPISE